MPAPTSKNILFADDNLDLQKTVRMYLERAGYTVRMVNDGWSCVHEVKRQRPDLLLLDVGMPKLDGLRTIEVLMGFRLLEDMPVVLFTGAADRETVLKAMSLGVADYLVKPFAIRDLGERVRRQLDGVTREQMRELLGGAKEVADLAPYAQISELGEKGWRPFSGNHQGLEACLLLHDLDLATARALADEPLSAKARVYLRRGKAGWRRAYP